jgi:hypothetical protein
MTTETVNRFETGISENNLRHWGMLEVVKEFLQNAVYAKTILGDAISIEHDGRCAVITNTPSGFSKGKLLIGESEQADVAGAPGQYGEGMKAAMAVARRCGKEVEILTNGFYVRPELEPSSLDASVKTLVFYLEDTDWVGGTRFKVECDAETLEKAKTYFAVLEGIDEQLTKIDTILDEYENVVYVNGVMITETPTVFGYNFTNPELMNRDRTSVNNEKLKLHVRAIMSTTKSLNVAEGILSSIVDNDTTVEAVAGMGYAEVASHAVWKQAAKNVFGPKACMAAGNEFDTKAQYHHIKILTTVPGNWRYFFENTLDIPFSTNMAELADKVKNKHVKGTAEENNNLGWAKRLVKLYYGDYGTVRVSDVVMDEYGNSCYGTYNRTEDITWLKRSILASKEETFKTLLHETIHRVSGAHDNTPYFTSQWEHACWMIMTRGRGEA